jgi:hypothetical protein
MSILRSAVTVALSSSCRSDFFGGLTSSHTAGPEGGSLRSQCPSVPALDASAPVYTSAVPRSPRAPTPPRYVPSKYPTARGICTLRNAPDTSNKACTSLVLSNCPLQPSVVSCGTATLFERDRVAAAGAGTSIRSAASTGNAQRLDISECRQVRKSRTSGMDLERESKFHPCGRRFIRRGTEASDCTITFPMLGFSGCHQP